MATLVRCAMGYKPTGPKVAASSPEPTEAGVLPVYENEPAGERRPLLGDEAYSYQASETSGSETIAPSASSGALSFFNNPRVISDAVIGLSDGLTVPFALTAGLSSLGNTKVVITGGIAELVSGAISMGLGGYLGAKSESDCYKSALEREQKLLENSRGMSEEAVVEALTEFGFAPSTLNAILGDLEKNPEEMVTFMMKFVRGMEEPPIGREFTSAATIGLAYFFGGFVPLFPYFFVHTVQLGLMLSVILMIITLMIFGIVKTILTGNNSKWQALFGGIQMVITGCVAAGAAWGMVRLIDSH
ncbi:VIT family-domain-containing protein [Dipodascopsis tothii]|uniref:VIT family-domain-containing protein n=1 Tax=Dipodascopsis tothii TaxID=44089 RepID=UPI0034CF0F83